jgi:hypothetical protein
VSAVISTLGGSGRRANSCGMAGLGLGRATGVGTLEVDRGVTAFDDRGLFLGLDLDGVVAERVRGGADVDLGGGGGRFAGGGAIGGAF